MALYRHTARGVFPGENWSINVWTTGTGAVGSAQTAWVSAVSALFPAGVLALYATQFSVTSASTAQIDETTNAQITRLDNAISLVGTSASVQLPFNLAVAVSLKSSLATRAGRGRFYMPAPASNAVAVGRLATASQTTLLNAAVAMRGSLSTSGFTVVVRNPPPTPNTRTVNRIEVGDVFDQQTRRRKQLVEVRSGTNV